MISIQQQDGQLDIELSSDPDLMEHVTREAQYFITESGYRKNTDLKVIIRELVSNAIIHGNRMDPERHVKMHLEHMGGGTFSVMITDEGTGFDYQSVKYNLPDRPSNSACRGLALVKALTCRLEFNGAGNGVVATFGLDPVVGTLPDDRNERNPEHANMNR
jgi:anti-sigma regulatory factor (Ser/Thr protein kinase)